MVGSPARQATAATIGADAYIDYHTADLAKAVSAACEGGFDFALDVIGKKGMIDLVVASVKPNGAAAVYGLDSFASLTLDLSKIFKPFRYSFSNYEESESHDRVVEFIQAGKLRAEPYLNLANPFPFDQIQAAYDYTRQRKGLKALVKISH